jgi:HSP20 family protein
MSNLTRWEPMREMITLREAMDRLFDDAFTRPMSASGVSVIPALDLYETSDEIVVRVNLPGMKSDDVQISVTGDMLTLRGEVKPAGNQKDVTYHILERKAGVFERTVTLPADVQAEKAKADFENGVLTITMPKSEIAKPKTISIKSK